jgi:hypothetical protein
MMSEEQRSRLDTVLDPSFVEGLFDLSPAELRAKLRDARGEEDALSYVRRNLHGRLDLLRAELESRRAGGGDGKAGGESMAASGLEALAAALTEHNGSGRGVRPGLGLRAAAVAGRRRAERVLSEDHLSRLPELDDGEIEEVVNRVSTAERKLSDDRHRLHEVIELLESELAARYKNGLEPSLERLQ